MSRTQLLVVSGLSGSGKSSALRCFEDLGYYCVDNLPTPLMPVLIDLCMQALEEPRVALVVDARMREFLLGFESIWEKIRGRYPGAQLLFLDADENVLVHRFSETRRPHPLSPEGHVVDGIRGERELLGTIRRLADRVIDTSAFTVHELRTFLLDRFGDDSEGALMITVTSFGFRKGVLENADLVFDLRFLPNPYYDSELRDLTGLDKPVREFVESCPETGEFLEHFKGMLCFLLPKYAEEGKTYLTLGLGCTGGRHRSVAIAVLVASWLGKVGHRTSLSHRDVDMASV